MVKIINFKQGIPEWKAHRLNHRNSSESPVVVGANKYMTRDKLIELKATKSEKEFSDYVQNVILESGHTAEKAARPIIEKQFDIELSPMTLANGKWSASFDGIEFGYARSWEHKVYNKELFELVKSGGEPADHIWQMEHCFIVVPELKEIIFTVSDGTEENMVSMIYKSDKKRQKKLIAAWDLFDADVLAYVAPEAKAETIKPVTATLPAITHEVRGTLVVSNLSVFKECALALVEQSKLPMVTDQEFVDAIALVKTFEEIESKLKAKREQVIAEFADLNRFTTELSEIEALIRQARLTSAKSIDSEKAKRKKEILDAGINQVKAYIAAKVKLFDGAVQSVCPNLSNPQPFFDAAVKGKSAQDKMIEAVNQTVATLQLQINEECDLISENLAAFAKTGAPHGTLFPDLQQLLTKQADDFIAVLESRIAKHLSEEAKKALAIEEARKIEEAKKAETVAAAPAVVVINTEPEPLSSVQHGAAFNNEETDIDMLLHVASHLESLVFPEMKTLRCQQISLNAQNAIKNVSDKIRLAAKSI